MTDERPQHGRFPLDWLALREPADHAARSRMLEQRLVAELGSRGTPWRIIDLGTGSGSNPRHLAPRLPGPQHWRLTDHDPELLDRAEQALRGLRHPDGAALQFEYEQRSIGSATDPTGASIVEPQAGPCDLITASALLDLVSAAWIDALANRARALGSLVLITMSVDGRWRFRPHGRLREQSHDGAQAPSIDEQMLALYRAHQARDKGLGRALGGRAPERLAEALRSRGFDVVTAPSPWHLDRRDLALARALLAGWRDALIEQAPEQRDEIVRWAELRATALDDGALTVEVGHVDLLGIPA